MQTLDRGIESIVKEAAETMQNDPESAAVEFDKAYHDLFQTGFSVNHIFDMHLLTLVAEILYFKAFQHLASKHGVFDGTIDTITLPKYDEFSDSLDHIRKAGQYDKQGNYFAYCFNHRLKYLSSDNIVPSSDEAFREIPGTGAFVYESAVEGMSDIMGKIIFRSVHRYPEDYREMMTFYRTLLGIKKLAPPFGVAQCSDGVYYVIPYGDDDLEKVFANAEVSSGEKQSHLMKDLMIHAELQRKFRQFFVRNDDVYTLHVVHRSIFGNSILQKEFPAHDYMSELEESMIVGRISDKKDRLAKKGEYSEEVRRKYFYESNPALDNLIVAAKKFVKKFLIHEDFEILDSLVDLDAQPSNYLASGKVTDLVKIRGGNPIYTAARLLGHPATVRFTGTLSTEEKAKFHSDLYSSDDKHIQSALSCIEDHPSLLGEDPFFSVFLARRLLDAGAQMTLESPKRIARYHQSFDAHKA